MRQGRRQLLWHQRLSHRILVFGLLPSLVNDALLYSGALVTFELVGLALFAHIIAINVGIFASAGELFAGLERTVDERTAELTARERELSHMLAVRRRILDAIPDTLCLLRDGRLDYVNEAGERFLRNNQGGCCYMDPIRRILITGAAAMATAAAPRVFAQQT